MPSFSVERPWHRSGTHAALAGGASSEGGCKAPLILYALVMIKSAILHTNLAYMYILQKTLKVEFFDI